MAIQLITPPASEPVTLQEAKDHLRIDVTDDDALIENLLIPSARQSFETDSGCALMTQTWELALDCFEQAIELYKPPVQSVTSIKYIDVSGVEQTLDPSEYAVSRLNVERMPAIVEPAYGKNWPAIRNQSEAVKIRYVAGYTSVSAVPQLIKSAMLLLIGQLYENREEEVIGTIVTPLTFGYRSIVKNYKVWGF